MWRLDPAWVVDEIAIYVKNDLRLKPTRKFSAHPDHYFDRVGSAWLCWFGSPKYVS